MKLILNLLLLFVAFALVRRAIRRFLAPASHQPPPRRRPGSDAGSAQQSGKHPALNENEVIEDAEFEELD